VVVAPSDAGDPWAETDAGVATDASVEVDDRTDDDDDSSLPSGEMLFGQFMDPKQREEMKTQCRQAVAQKLPAGVPAEALLGLAVCHCVLGETAKAEAIAAKVKDQAMRNGIHQLCAAMGTKLK
jgi:hypothetical protein